MHRLSLLLVDHDIDSRMRLRHAVSTVDAYGETTQANNLEDARHRLEQIDQPLDLIFISYEFPRDQVTRFIQEGKDFKAGEDAAFIMLFPGNEDKNARIAEGLLAGVDGFLFEPFSIDDLVGMGALAAKIKQRRAAAREAISIRFMIKDIVKLVDVRARLTAMGCESTKVYARLVAIHESLQAFQPESRALYFSLIIDTFILQPVPDPLFQRFKNAGIRSMRLRRKLAECLIDGIENNRKHQEELRQRLPVRRITTSR
jgi:response regulator RpfG family c-di-GMP phosphodiesterase